MVDIPARLLLPLRQRQALLDVPIPCRSFHWAPILKLVDDGLGDVGGLGVTCKKTRERYKAERIPSGDVPPKSAVLTLPSFKTSYVAVAMALACFSRL